MLFFFWPGRGAEPVPLRGEAAFAAVPTSAIFRFRLPPFTSGTLSSESEADEVGSSARASGSASSPSGPSAKSASCLARDAGMAFADRPSPSESSASESSSSSESSESPSFSGAPPALSFSAASTSAERREDGASASSRSASLPVSSSSRGASSAASIGVLASIRCATAPSVRPFFSAAVAVTLPGLSAAKFCCLYSLARTPSTIL
mmetsp:Transcript_16474/g.29285  ORF Transcript_16474/g.29285 Transcript_16474/m.29285 type:complete len:206 (-) Transcript_16474:1825-2442(-)